MPTVSLFRLYVLRATYLLLVVGLFFDQWIPLIQHPDTWGQMRGVVACLLCAISLLSLLGLRYPLAMLPLLLFELAWKVIWMLAIAMPLCKGKGLDANFKETAFACGMGVIVVAVVMPWSYVWSQYVLKGGDRWK